MSFLFTLNISLLMSRFENGMQITSGLNCNTLYMYIAWYSLDDRHQIISELNYMYYKLSSHKKGKDPNSKTRSLLIIYFKGEVSEISKDWLSIGSFKEVKKIFVLSCLQQQRYNKYYTCNLKLIHNFFKSFDNQALFFIFIP